MAAVDYVTVVGLPTSSISFRKHFTIDPNRCDSSKPQSRIKISGRLEARHANLRLHNW